MMMTRAGYVIQADGCKIRNQTSTASLNAEFERKCTLELVGSKLAPMVCYTQGATPCLSDDCETCCGLRFRVKRIEHPLAPSQDNSTHSSDSWAAVQEVTLRTSRTNKSNFVSYLTLSQAECWKLMLMSMSWRFDSFTASLNHTSLWMRLINMGMALASRLRS